MKSIKEGLIATADGEGIGNEVITAASRVLRAAARKYSLNIRHVKILLGDEAEAVSGNALPKNSIIVSKGCSAVLTGPLKGGILMELGRCLGAAFCSLPVTSFPQLSGKMPFKPEILNPGVNILFIMPCDEYDLYGKESATENIVFESMSRNRKYAEKAAAYAVKRAATRKRKITVIDIDERNYFRNYIEKSLFSGKFPLIDVRYMTPENLMAELISMPSIHDIILTPIWYGLMYFRAIATAVSSIYMLPIKIWGRPNIYVSSIISQCHLSGVGKANPIGAIMAAAFLLEHSFLQRRAALAIRNSVISVIDKGFKTEDICSKGDILVSTGEMAELIMNELRNTKKQGK